MTKNPENELAAVEHEEPSMEEILSSIRRIISEDEEGAPEAPLAKASPASAVEAGEAGGGDPEAEDADVLELTQMVADDGKVVHLAEGKEPKVEMTAKADEHEERREKAPVDNTELELRDTEAAPSPAAAVADSLLSDATATAATQSFSTLTKAVTREGGPGTRLYATADKTLEDIVKELLRPMLKEWLDQNLPTITEKLVRKEVERAARRAEEL